MVEHSCIKFTEAVSMPLQLNDELPSRALQQIESEDPHRFDVGQTVPASPQIVSEPHEFDASKSGSFTTAY